MWFCLRIVDALDDLVSFTLPYPPYARPSLSLPLPQYLLPTQTKSLNTITRFETILLLLKGSREFRGVIMNNAYGFN